MVNPIHTDRSVQGINVRLYFDAELDSSELLDKIADALQNAPDLCDMISAYELRNDGFGNLLPDDTPLA